LLNYRADVDHGKKLVGWERLYNYHRSH
jgi:hypothetical protein